MKEKLIARMARARGLDPRAVLADMRGEGLSGGIGDGGHAFGPAQMNNAGGVLTGKFQGWSPEQINRWAWSKQGLAYALDGMARVAKGKTGEAAVRAIVTQYERPADIPGAIATRLGYLKQGGGSVGGSIQGGGGQQPGRSVGGGMHFDAANYRKQAALMMGQEAVARARGIDTSVDPETGQQMPGLAERMQQLQQANMVPTVGGQHVKGGPGRTPGGSGAGDELVSLAAKQLGQPYVWGGESRQEGGFDCSGLVSWAASHMGVSLPRTTTGLIKAGRRVPMSKLKPGDLLVSNEHVVIFAGNGRVIAAPHTGTNVQWQDASAFTGGGYQARRVVG